VGGWVFENTNVRLLLNTRVGTCPTGAQQVLRYSQSRGRDHNARLFNSTLLLFRDNSNFTYFQMLSTDENLSVPSKLYSRPTSVWF
jgi:hypothetical protein